MTDACFPIEDEKSRRRRDSFLATASRLSRRLVDMDRTAATEAERRRRGGPKSRSRRGAQDDDGTRMRRGEQDPSGTNRKSNPPMRF